MAGRTFGPVMNPVPLISRGFFLKHVEEKEDQREPVKLK